MTTVYVVLQGNTYGTADLRGVFTDRTEAERVVDEESMGYEAWVEEAAIDQLLPMS